MTELDELKRRIETCHATIREQRAEIDRLHACAEELLRDLQRIDETSCLSDGDSVSVCVALWAGDWAKRMKDAGFVTANTPNQARRQPSEVGCSAFIVHDMTGSVPDQICKTRESAEAWVRQITEARPNARPVIQPNKEFSSKDMVIDDAQEG